MAAKYVAENLFPAIRADLPDVTLRIVGASPNREIRALGAAKGVIVVGPVLDISIEVRRAAVAVLPMLNGTGMKNKVLEAFSSGTPVVTNAAGIDGVEGARPSRDYIEAEDPSALARAVVALIKDDGRRREISRSARRLVETRFTWDRQARRLLALYRAPT